MATLGRGVPYLHSNCALEFEQATSKSSRENDRARALLRGMLCNFRCFGAKMVSNLGCGTFLASNVRNSGASLMRIPADHSRQIVGYTEGGETLAIRRRNAHGLTGIIPHYNRGGFWRCDGSKCHLQCTRALECRSSVVNWPLVRKPRTTSRHRSVKTAVARSRNNDGGDFDSTDSLTEPLRNRNLPRRKFFRVKHCSNAVPV